jgi:hypothetical protein
MGKRRDKSAKEKLIAFSVSYQREPLLARGLGLEHLHELVKRLARPLLRKGASIAYGGSWSDNEANFTYVLLRLINAEREENSISELNTSRVIGGLINHTAWPHHLDITPKIEAQWIDCCRIVRVTQELAGIPASDIVRDATGQKGTDRYLLNAAIALSKMRQLAMTGMEIPVPQAPSEYIPPIHARILMGGKVCGFHGFMPGIFEEALVTLEHEKPLYVLGGFGGAAETVAKLFLAPSQVPVELSLAWQEEHTPHIKKLHADPSVTMPSHVRSSANLLDALVTRGKGGLAALKTGLDDADTRELLSTCDIDRAVTLVREGLRNTLQISIDPFERT